MGKKTSQKAMNAMFDECYDAYLNQPNKSEKWHTLAQKWDFETAEGLRSWFRRQLQARGMPTKEQLALAESGGSDYVPNIVLFDIETSPIDALVWSPKQEYIQPDAILQDWYTFGWAAKPLFSAEMYSSIVTPKEAKAADDSRVMAELWEIVNNADILIAHNATGFDIKRINTRFLVNGMNPPMPYRVIDTLTTARSVFAFSYNRLDFIASTLGLGRKLETGFKLWRACFFGDPDALAKMREYNEQDVQVLEEVYLMMRPYIKGHPSIAPYYGEPDAAGRCPYCGYKKHIIDGEYATDANTYNAARCGHCGAIMRVPTGNLPIGTRRQMLRPMPISR